MSSDESDKDQSGDAIYFARRIAWRSREVSKLSNHKSCKCLITITKSSYFVKSYTSRQCQDLLDGYTYYDLHPSQKLLLGCSIYVCKPHKIVLAPFVAQNQDKNSKASLRCVHRKACPSAAK